MGEKAAAGGNRETGDRRRNRRSQAGLDYPEDVMGVSSRYRQHLKCLSVNSYQQCANLIKTELSLRPPWRTISQAQER